LLSLLMVERRKPDQFGLEDEALALLYKLVGW